MLRLEKLEIMGFKSFPDRTTLKFGEGITGVVGPNGCGKSNIADAISWVLGEQSPKNLRGGKMEDVIFNGTRDRKPVGMSEVLLTLVAIEDIAARDDDSQQHDDETSYDRAIENAERAADTVKLLVEQNDPQDESDDKPAATGDAQAAPPAELSPSDQSPDANTSQPADASQTAEGEQAAAGDQAAHRRRTLHYRKRKTIAISAGERITVGRRLYRTGDSEYLMNGRACLLREIQDLFAGTGLGGAHYAIIEQGRIGQILSSKPLDRRALIEEAAGITKFKSRKRSAELKLESAKQNLTRLNDIISEVERQVNSLKRQAAKSRRFKRLREEMRGLQKLVFAADYHRLTEAISRIAAELEAVGNEQQRLDALLAERESEHRVATAETRSVEDGLTEMRQRAATVGLEADRLRNRRAFEEQQLSELTLRIKDLDRDSAHLDERLEFLETERDRRTSDLTALETDVADRQRDLIDREATYQAALARLREVESSIEDLRQRLLSETGRTERLRNLAVNLEETLRRVELRLSSLEIEMERAAQNRDEAARQQAAAREQIEGNLARLLELSEQLVSKVELLDHERASVGELKGRLDKLQSDRRSAELRLASLEKLDSHHAYYSDAVQQVLSPEHAASINALGTLADFVEVEPQYERLVESLFARELQCILVPTIDDALAGVEYLKSEGLGRGAFLVVGLHGGEDDEPEDRFIECNPEPGDGDEQPPEMLLPRPPEPSPYGPADWTSMYAGTVDFGPSLQDTIDAAEHPEEHLSDDRMFWFQNGPIEEDSPRFQIEVLRAIDLIKVRSEIKAVIERAFPEKCQASVVPDLEAALHRSLESGWHIFVTTDGDQVVNGRLIVTGVRAGQNEGSLLALKREIKELRVQLEAQAPSEAELSADVATSQERLMTVEREATTLDGLVREHEKVVAAGDSQIAGLERDLGRAVQHVEVVRNDIEQLERERTELQERLAQLAPDIISADASRSEVEQSLGAGQLVLLELRGQAERFAEELSAARADLAARNERLTAARSELRRIENEAEELRARINRNRLELYESHTRVEQITAAQQEAEAASNALQTEIDSLAGSIAQQTEALAALRTRVDELDVIVVELRQTTAAAHDRRSQMEVDRARTEAEAQHLSRTCFSELAMSIEDVVTSVELAQAATEFDEGSSTEQRAPEISADAETTMESALTSEVFDIETARIRLDELRIKIDEMGPVNMMALEELEQATERSRFLTEQRLDIINSIRGTEEALAEIKRRSRERFRQAFASINENFQRMFLELFGGGRGEMILIDEEDVLESGIDLIAQPPGKRLQNVLLLSGGEKAMAAIALVLAIFQYRPSPFCILDEVDAPLDEVNVGRFADEVTRMSQDTQFLVVTHNKRTMEAARALYGVTMEQPGVSKLVSVRFE